MKMWILGLVLVPVAGFAHELKAGNLTIGHPWTRATPGGSDMAAGYLKVVNSGTAADALVGAEVDGVGHVMMHETKDEGGVAKMEHVDKVVIAAGQTVELKPGGVHLMWMDMTTPLKAGETVSGVLVFDKAGRVPVGFKVEAAGAKMPAVEHHKH